MTGRLTTTTAALAAVLLVGCTGQDGGQHGTGDPDGTGPAGPQEPAPEQEAETGQEELPDDEADDAADEPDEPGEPDEPDEDREWGSQILDPDLEGVVHQQLGQWTGIHLEEEIAAAFVIEDMVLLLDCPASEAEPENDRFLALQIEVETSPDMEERGLSLLPMSAQDFGVRLRDGAELEGLLGNAADCYPSDERLPEALGPGEEASGVVALDVPADVEAVLLDGQQYSLAGGWEWPMPQASEQ